MSRLLLIVFGGVVSLAIIIIVVLLLRSRPNTETITLTIWSPFDEGKIYEEMSQPFLLKERTNLKLEFRYIEAKDAKDYEAKVVDAIASGHGPDIWLTRFDWLPKHVSKSIPAIPARKSDNPIEIAKSFLLPAVVDLNIYNGKLYGVPLFADSLALIYNNDFYSRIYNELPGEQQKILDKEPTSWETLKAQASLISRSRSGALSRSAIALGTSNNTIAATDVLAALLIQNKIKILSDDGKDVVFNLAVFINNQPHFPAAETLDFYTSFARPDQPNYSWSPFSGDPLEKFLASEVGSITGYLSTLKQVRAANPSFKIQVFPFPQKDPDSPIYFISGWTHLVNAQSKQSSLAWAYLSYLMEVETQNFYSQKTGRLSTSLKQLPPSDSAERVFQNQLKTGSHLTKPEWQIVDESLQDAVNLVIRDNQTAQTVVDTIAQRFKQFVN